MRFIREEVCPGLSKIETPGRFQFLVCNRGNFLLPEKKAYSIVTRIRESNESIAVSASVFNIMIGIPARIIVA